MYFGILNLIHEPLKDVHVSMFSFCMLHVTTLSVAICSATPFGGVFVGVRRLSRLYSVVVI